MASLRRVPCGNCLISWPGLHRRGLRPPQARRSPRPLQPTARASTDVPARAVSQDLVARVTEARAAHHDPAAPTAEQAREGHGATCLERSEELQLNRSHHLRRRGGKMACCMSRDRTAAGRSRQTDGVAARSDHINNAATLTATDALARKKHYRTCVGRGVSSNARGCSGHPGSKPPRRLICARAAGSTLCLLATQPIDPPSAPACMSYSPPKEKRRPAALIDEVSEATPSSRGSYDLRAGAPTKLLERRRRRARMATSSPPEKRRPAALVNEVSCHRRSQATDPGSDARLQRAAAGPACTGLGANTSLRRRSKAASALRGALAGAK